MGSQPSAHAGDGDARKLDTRPAPAEHPSCGDQPANISLTARRQRHAHHENRSDEARAAAGNIPDGGSPMPLDRTALHISAQIQTAGPATHPEIRGLSPNRKRSWPKSGLKKAKADQVAFGTAGAHRTALAPLVDITLDGRHA
jgi:hypothetical protein